MKMSQFVSITLVIILGMLLNTCGQMTAKDEGMVSKSIGESSGLVPLTTQPLTTQPPQLILQHQQFPLLPPQIRTHLSQSPRLSL